MKLVHMADLHLGFRQYQRQTRDGFNQREADVARAFRNVIDKTIEISPDLVVIAGDVFHAVRPPNHALRFAYTEFARLRAALPAADIVMVAGNHDTPRTVDSGYIIPIFAQLGIIVIEGQPKRLSLRGGELSVFAVGHMGELPELVPDASAKYNVLVIHTGLSGITTKFARPDDVRAEELNADTWNYVALGDYHVYQQVAPNAYYSGSIEYTSSNIWRDVVEQAKNPEGSRGKGIIEQNLATGEHRFHLIPGNREVIDLPPISGAEISAAALTEAIVEAATDIDDKVVRLVVTGVPKHVVRDLDHRRIRQLKARALNFLLDTRVPETVEIGASVRASRKPMSINDLVREMLGEREMSPGIDRGELIDLAMHYLAKVDEAAPAVDVVPPVDTVEAAA